MDTPKGVSIGDFRGMLPASVGRSDPGPRPGCHVACQPVDFDFPPDDDPRRLAIREWLAANPDPDGATLAGAGYVAPHWPEPWGLDADPLHQLLIDAELRRAGVSRPANTIGIGWAGPTILHAGTEERKARYLFPLLAGEEIWCQLFSEPGAGSDVASLQPQAGATVNVPNTTRPRPTDNDGRAAACRSCRSISVTPAGRHR